MIIRIGYRTETFDISFEIYIYIEPIKVRYFDYDNDKTINENDTINL